MHKLGPITACGLMAVIPMRVRIFTLQQDSLHPHQLWSPIGPTRLLTTTTPLTPAPPARFVATTRRWCGHLLPRWVVAWPSAPPARPSRAPLVGTCGCATTALLAITWDKGLINSITPLQSINTSHKHLCDLTSLISCVYSS